MKRLIAVFGIVLAILSVTVISASAASVMGVCGDDATWSLDDSLTIWGSGAMWNFSTSNFASWYEYKEEFPVERVTIRYGITSIGDYSFYGCSKLTKLLFPSSVTHIGVDILNGCDRFKTIMYDGTISDWQRTIIEKPNDKLLSSNMFPDSAYVYGNGNGNSIEIGTSTITQSVVCSSPQSMDYLVLKIKYPSCFKMSNYSAKDFQLVVKDSEIVGEEYTTATFTCQYSPSSLAPSDTALTPIEMTFNIDPKTPIGTYDISLEDGTEGIDSEGNTISFGELAANSIRIVPKKITSIKIEGDAEVYDTAQYSVRVIPTDTPMTSISWEVSDTDIAEITPDGVLTAKKNGTVTVIARAIDGSGLFAEKAVKVYAYATIDTLTSDTGTWNKPFSPNAHSYQIYVDTDTTSIALTPSFVGGSLMCDGALWINNRSKEFALSDDMTIIELKRIGFEDYVDSTYTIVVIKRGDNDILNAIGDYQDKLFIEKDITDNTLTISLTPLSTIDLSNLKLYVAKYTDKTLYSIHQFNSILDNNKMTFVIELPKQTDYKILLWDNKNCPIIEAISNQ